MKVLKKNASKWQQQKGETDLWPESLVPLRTVLSVALFLRGRFCLFTALFIREHSRWLLLLLAFSEGRRVGAVNLPSANPTGASLVTLSPITGEPPVDLGKKIITCIIQFIYYCFLYSFAWTFVCYGITLISINFTKRQTYVGGHSKSLQLRCSDRGFILAWQKMSSTVLFVSSLRQETLDSCTPKW